MNCIHLAVLEHVCGIRKDSGNAEAFGELARHQLIGVAGGHQFAIREVLQLVGVLIRDHAAADDPDVGLRSLSHSSGT